MSTSVEPPVATPPNLKRGDVIAIIVSAVVLTIAVLLAAFFPFTGQAPEAAPANEVFLLPADSVGEDPFNGAAPTPAEVEPATTATAAPVGALYAPEVSGVTPGLYGVKPNDTQCDADQLTAFLQGNPDKAATWVQALDSRKNLRFGATDLFVDDVASYIAQLTPLALAKDILVTNYTFPNGAASSVPSVLQKGTAVLVDRYGVPRVRCLGGNPLSEPDPVSITPEYRGQGWPDFDPTIVDTIVGADGDIDTFEVLDLANRDNYPRYVPAGVCVLGQLCDVPGAYATQESPTGTQIPVAVAPVAPDDGACTARGDSPATGMFVRNDSAVLVDIWWYSYDCLPMHYGRLDPGESLSQETFEGYLWAATSGSATAVSTFTAGHGGWVIQ